MNIYVGNLAYGVTDAELKSTFAPFGEVVSAEVIIDKRSGRSRGYGFVRMANDDQGRAAIGALSGKELQGRPIRVDESKAEGEKRSRGGGRPGGGRGGGGYGRHQPARSRSQGATEREAPATEPPRKGGFLSFLKSIFS